MRMWFLVLGLLLPATVYAQGQCTEPSYPSTKPLLQGRVYDGAQLLEFIWRSSARKITVGNASSWEIENEVCNKGQVSLIISWPKASILTNGFRPLPPYKSILNSYSTGSIEPEAGHSQIKYGYRGDTATAQNYDSSNQTAKIIPLNSRIESTIAEVPSSVKLTEDALKSRDYPIKHIRFDFQSTPAADGYDFSFYPKTSEARFFWVGIASNNSKALIEAFAKARAKFRVGELQQISKSVPENWLEKFGRAEFIFVEPRGNYDTVKVRVQVQPKRTTFSNVVLLDSDLIPVAAGRIAMFSDE